MVELDYLEERTPEVYADIERLRSLAKQFGGVMTFNKVIEPSVASATHLAEITIDATPDVTNVNRHKMMNAIVSSSLNFLETVRDSGFPADLNAAGYGIWDTAHAQAAYGFDLFERGLTGKEISPSGGVTDVNDIDYNHATLTGSEDYFKRISFLLGVGADPVPGVDKIAGNITARTRIRWMQYAKALKSHVDEFYLSLAQSGIAKLLINRLRQDGIPDEVEFAQNTINETWKYLLGLTSNVDLEAGVWLALDLDFFVKDDLFVDALRTLRHDQKKTFFVEEHALQRAMNDYGIGVDELMGATIDYAHLLWIGDEQDVDTRKVGYELLLALKYFKTFSQRWIQAWKMVTSQEHWQYKQFLTPESAGHVQFDLGKLGGYIGPNRLKPLLKHHMVSARTIANQVIQDDVTPIQQTFSNSILEDLMIATDDDTTYIFGRNPDLFTDDDLLGFFLRMEALWKADSYADSQVDFFVLQGIAHVHTRMQSKINYVHLVTDTEKASGLAVIKEGQDSPLFNIVEHTLFNYTNPADTTGILVGISTQEVPANLPPDKFSMPHVEHFLKRDSRFRFMKTIWPNSPLARTMKDDTALESEKKNPEPMTKVKGGNENKNANKDTDDDDE